VPLIRTVAPLTKLVPFTVSVKAPEPTMAVEGCRDVSVGVGLLMVRVSALDVPPPGVGLVTVIAAVPVDVISVARIAAVNCVALTNVVVRAVPLTLTVAPLTKLVPLTVSVKAPEPTIAVEGCSEVSVGVGLLAGLMVKAAELELPPPEGFVTTTAALPAVAISLASTATVSCVELTKVVVRAVPLNVVVAPLTKFVPFTVRLKAAEPAVADDGDSEVMAGLELDTGAVWVMTKGTHPAVMVRMRVAPVVFCATRNKTAAVPVPVVALVS